MVSPDLHQERAFGRFYRTLAKAVFHRWADSARGALKRVSAQDLKEPVEIWFHAASLGELESLLPLIYQAAAHKRRFALSIFSQSAAKALERLSQELARTAPGTCVAAGFSPSEGEWGAVLEQARPSRWITAKYEAWPDIWAACARLEIPIAILGARPRRTFAWAAWMAKRIEGKSPRVCAIAFEEADAERFRGQVWCTQVELGFDPRWDRVRERAGRVHSRAQFVWALVQSRCPGPYGVLAQVWQEDMRVWKRVLGKLPGTLIVFPHSLDPAVLMDLERNLQGAGWRVRRTAGMTDLPEDVPHGLRDAWLVNEIGFLAEFYAKADWVFVGGGFGKGIHSTLEPAAYGLPIAIGPARAEKFPEVAFLQKQGQLSIVRDVGQLQAWVQSRPWEWGRARRAEWKKELPAPGEPTAGIQKILEGLRESSF